jgi:sugar phosphate isomerase/epimerase
MSHAYMVAVMGARQPGLVQTEKYGVVGLGRALQDKIAHLHISDSDGTLYGEGESSTHLGLGQGKMDLETELYYMRHHVMTLSWWTVDLNQNPDPERAAREAVPILRDYFRQFDLDRRFM